MPEFFTRIELHSAHDYDGFHREMAARGGTRYVSAVDGKLYELPTGCYMISALTVAAAHNAAQAAANAIGKVAMIVVTHTDALTFSGLPERSLLMKYLSAR